MAHATHTEAQGALPQDPDIWRTAVRQSQGHVGVYAAVVRVVHCATVIG